MKNISINKVLVLSFFMTLIGCTEDDLTFESKNDPQQSEVTDFNTFVIGMYDAYQKVPANEYLITELRSDNMVSESGDGDLGNIGAFRINADLGDGSFYWVNNYSVVLNANLVLENVATVDFDEDFFNDDAESAAKLRAQYRGEAYFMRALSHFNLVRNFLNIPYIDQVLEDKDDVLNFPQLNPTDTYYRIIEDFVAARDNLLFSGGNQSRNKANYLAAKGMLAKAYMSQPVPNYDLALVELEDLIVDSNLSLQDSFSTLFYKDNELNQEILFAISYGGGTSVSADIRFDDQVEGDSQVWSFNMSANGRAGGMACTDDFMNVILPFDGVDKRTIRFKEGSLTTDDDYHKLYQFDENEERYFNAKFDDGTDDTSAIDWIVLRYADILLLHAEAIIGNDRSTSDPAALASYNLVRERAGMPQLGPDELLSEEALLLERRIELFFENHRLYDLIRFGVSDFAIPIMNRFAIENGYSFNPNLLYLPIPQREIDVTGGNFYKQNPGY